MVAMIALLLLIAIFFGAGAAIHALWIAAVIGLVLLLVGFAVRPSGRRWYYW